MCKGGIGRARDRKIWKQRNDCPSPSVRRGSYCVRSLPSPVSTSSSFRRRLDSKDVSHLTRSFFGDIYTPLRRSVERITTYLHCLGCNYAR